VPHAEVQEEQPCLATEEVLFRISMPQMRREWRGFLCVLIQVGHVLGEKFTIFIRLVCHVLSFDIFQVCSSFASFTLTVR
jgi:hypothetical protein